MESINHITFSVSNLDKSIEFYEKILNGKLLVKGDKLAYFDLNGLWLALNLEEDIPRNEIYKSYTHISFTIDEKDFEKKLEELRRLDVNIQIGRPRHKDEGKSIYFRDPDGHLFEFHTKSRDDRINYYKINRDDLEFFI
ncbi:Metallothiol transferase FosB [[Clostridium] ultunense Esp]|uniref:Metallothiol transferase n=1 Tax=[Clostridium] ultunense Esp TaxID=1288971 RepID=M1YQI7_9FIRM|nr:metallothiol transferase FosB [Schnuerera ultunensis]CCQ92805.1 Metallothiol transferase FosB [[Clostridium] ultunense Esp]SHD75818.1 metallothiol transferase [[Clostridium] ultunense Esp]